MSVHVMNAEEPTVDVARRPTHARLVVGALVGQTARSDVASSVESGKPLQTFPARCFSFSSLVDT